MRTFRLLVLALSSSVLFALGLPNETLVLGFAPLGFLALAPLYLALLETGSWLEAGLLTGAYGALHHAISSYWLYFFKDFAFWTIGVTTIAYFVIYFFLGLCLVFLLKKGGASRPLGFALIWAAFEFLKSIGFLGYPWGLLPYTQSTLLPMLQIADITGVYGLSFLLAFFNAALGEILLRRAGPGILPLPGWGPQDLLGRNGKPQRGLRPGHPPRQILRLRLPVAPPLEAAYAASHGVLALALAGAVLAYGGWALSHPETPRGTLKTLVIQQNLDPWVGGAQGALVANMGEMRKALESGIGRPDLVLFSETSLGYPFKDSRSWYETNPKKDPFLPWFRQQGLWLFTGSPDVLDWKNFSATNSVMLIDPQGRVVADYAKSHPVPFAEAIPFYEYKWFRDLLKKTVGLEAGWTMGTELSVFSLESPLGPLAFGAPICFEDAFSDLCRGFVRKGADLLVNLTDDSWSQTKSAEWQHLAVARFRAIETRRPLLRSTNSGVSALVDASGAIRDVLPLFERTWAAIEVPIPPKTTTTYLALGDWFALLCLLLSTGWTLILVRRDSRERRRPL